MDFGIFACFNLKTNTVIVKLQHTSRTFYTENNTVLKKDAGILFVNMDRNSPRILKPYIKDLEKAKPLECSQYVLCGLPLPHPKIIEIM